uniref:Uncharacterized protein n=1 Tax=Oryza sativa subsp. japonica TaxID=39947 RepID=Q5Z4P2_ORYSJ|nr:hypothetical protein [Oryza sativa Japonica Group]
MSKEEHGSNVSIPAHQFGEKPPTRCWSRVIIDPRQDMPWLECAPFDNGTTHVARTTTTRGGARIAKRRSSTYTAISWGSDECKIEARGRGA